MDMSRVHVTIDRLVLHGIEPAERQAMVNGLQTELTRILADPAVRAAWTGSRRTPVLRLGKMPLGPGISGARKLGNGIARAIGKGAKR
jgi:hypothetical protein